jgi:quercetin dioxygenase-like cupin family protein
MTTAIIVDQFDLSEESWQDPSRGSIRWKTLLSGDVTASEKLVCGIAIMDAGETFTLHSHPDPELYFGLEGEVDVMIDGTLHRLKPGVALFIPGNAVHGILMADQPVRWFYSFAANAFADINYTFATHAVAANANIDIEADVVGELPAADSIAAIATVDMTQIFDADAVGDIAVVDVTQTTACDGAAANSDLAIAANANTDIDAGDVGDKLA